jgi:hypothetical protein
MTTSLIYPPASRITSLITWHMHVVSGQITFGGQNLTPTFFQMLMIFSHNLLFWLEVLSLTKEVHIASPALLSTADWAQVSASTETFACLVKMQY